MPSPSRALAAALALQVALSAPPWRVVAALSLLALIALLADEPPA